MHNYTGFICAVGRKQCEKLGILCRKEQKNDSKIYRKIEKVVK